MTEKIQIAGTGQGVGTCHQEGGRRKHGAEMRAEAGHLHRSPRAPSGSEMSPRSVIAYLDPLDEYLDVVVFALRYTIKHAKDQLREKPPFVLAYAAKIEAARKNRKKLMAWLKFHSHNDLGIPSPTKD